MTKISEKKKMMNQCGKPCKNDNTVDPSENQLTLITYHVWGFYCLLGWRGNNSLPKKKTAPDKVSVEKIQVAGTE